MRKFLNDPKDFWAWFDEARGQLSIRQVEQNAECPRGRIVNAHALVKQPSIQVCKTIAKGLNVDEEEVFRQAGILDPSKKVSLVAELSGISAVGSQAVFEVGLIADQAKLMFFFNNLSSEDQKNLVKYAEWLFCQHKEKTRSLKKNGSANKEEENPSPE